MAIVKMSSFSLLAFEAERDNLLHELQKFEYVHFTNLEEEEVLLDESLQPVSIPESVVDVDEEISKVRYSINQLSKYAVKDSGIKSLIEGKDNYTFSQLEEKALSIDYHPTYERIRQIALETDKIEQEILSLTSKKDELANWEGLDYPIGSLEGFIQTEVVMGTIPKKFKDDFNEDLLDLELTYAEIINEDKDGIYLFAITAKEEYSRLYEILRNYGFTTVSLDAQGSPKEEISNIGERLEVLKLEKKKHEDQIRELSSNLAELEIVYEYLMNKKLRTMATENFLKTDSINVIKGYIPTDMEEEFTKVITNTLGSAYYLEIKDADKDDPDVPILLKNSKFTQAFESLTSMYALPRYNEVDPTPFLAPFYLAFFGMMVADAGYGLLMLIGTFIALKFANLTESQEKFIRFFHYLSYSTIAWGLFFGSFLGGIVPLPGVMDPAAQYQDLLIMSIVFGGIHLFFALGIQAYVNIRDKKYLDALFDVGFWYMALMGGIVFLLTMVVELNPVVATIAKWVMIAGMVGIVLTGGREAESVGGKLAAGAYELYGISSYVGDFVSYSRLMALGLSGGFIASAINMMVGMLSNSGIIGILLGVVVFVVGQLFNVFLSFLGAYVHTIRLTYVEFFGKFYEGGGKAFQMFRSSPKYINYK
ncbi:MAG: V-type ATP synthase subunit I [Tissierellia bacterium]|jgi:V/A-type H+-transporting ATPase subunit I|nr:V-type ATP synthase subunit I [Tissierellia bacterium]